MRSIVLALVLACAPALGEEWTPPENPDPQAILQEARRDTAAKRYETALAKHVWFHEKALSIEPALYGVRLSFALSYWHELAQEYPPALAKLKEFRDQAAKHVMAGQRVRQSFHDMASINETLGEEAATKAAFETLDQKDPAAAKIAFDLVQPALVKAKAYGLLGKYVDPKKDFSSMVRLYEAHKRMADDPRFGDQLLEHANKTFANNTATLVAILAVNERKPEAEEISRFAREKWNDASFHAELDKALQGIVPEPWP